MRVGREKWLGRGQLTTLLELGKRKGKKNGFLISGSRSPRFASSTSALFIKERKRTRFCADLPCEYNLNDEVLNTHRRSSRVGQCFTSFSCHSNAIWTLSDEGQRYYDRGRQKKTNKKITTQKKTGSTRVVRKGQDSSKTLLGSSGSPQQSHPCLGFEDGPDRFLECEEGGELMDLYEE